MMIGQKNIKKYLSILLRIIYNCEAQNYLIHFILRQSKPIIEKVINEKSKNTNIKEEDKDFLCLFYSGALGALIINWI